MKPVVEMKWITSRKSAPDQAEVFIDDICSCICTIYNNGKAEILVIDNVKTKEEYRNNGYGTVLINHVLMMAKEWKIDSVELIVNSDNEVAKRLYDKTGFKKTEKEHYRILLNEWTSQQP